MNKIRMYSSCLYLLILFMGGLWGMSALFKFGLPDYLRSWNMACLYPFHILIIIALLLPAWWLFPKDEKFLNEPEKKSLSTADAIFLGFVIFFIMLNVVLLYQFSQSR